MPPPHHHENRHQNEAVEWALVVFWYLYTATAIGAACAAIVEHRDGVEQARIIGLVRGHKVVRTGW